LGWGAAHATTLRQDDDNVWRDAARAVGEVAWLFHVKAVALDEKYHVVETSVRTAQHTWQQARQYWRHHNLTARTQAWRQQTTQALWRYNQQHRVWEKSLHATGRAVGWAATQVERGIQLAQQPKKKKDAVVTTATNVPTNQTLTSRTLPTSRSTNPPPVVSTAATTSRTNPWGVGPAPP